MKFKKFEMNNFMLKQRTNYKVFDLLHTSYLQINDFESYLFEVDHPPYNSKF